MKFLKSILVLSILITVLSCGNKDDDGSDNSASLIATWRLTAETDNGQSVQLDECDLMETLTFTETLVTNTFFSGENCGSMFSVSDEYTRNGNTLNVMEDGDVFSVEITTLNNTTLVLTDNDEGDIYVSTYTRQ